MEKGCLQLWVTCLGEMQAERARPFALQVFDGEGRKGGRCGKGAAGREGTLERVIVWYDLPAGKKNRSESWRGKGTRGSEMKTPKEKKGGRGGGDLFEGTQLSGSR